MVILKTKTGMIPANETEIVFTDVNIEDSSIIEVYYDDNNVYTLETWQSGDDVHIITSPHSNQVGVKLLINNVDSFSPYDDSELRRSIAQTEQHISEIESDVDEIDTRLNELNASNIYYDEHSTLYSAMGDIDALETTSKNLVGAINENFTSVSNGKSLVASAITDKGVPTASDATFQTMATNIGQISGGGQRREINLLPRTSEKSWVDSAHVNKYDISNKTDKFDVYLTYDDSTGVFTPTQRAIDEVVVFKITLETNSYQTARSSKSEGSIDQLSNQVLFQTAPALTAGSYIIGYRYIYNAYTFRTRTPSSNGYPRQYITIDVLA